MSVSGLVIFLSSDAQLAQHACERLRSDQRLIVGDRFGPRLAVAAETESVAADRALVDELRALPGVEHVDVAFVGFDEHSPPTEPRAAPRAGASNKEKPDVLG